eukprot:9481496-Pyramimonas_sp.AAC.1
MHRIYDTGPERSGWLGPPAGPPGHFRRGCCRPQPGTEPVERCVQPRPCAPPFPSAVGVASPNCGANGHRHWRIDRPSL